MLKREQGRPAGHGAVMRDLNESHHLPYLSFILFTYIMEARTLPLWGGYKLKQDHGCVASSEPLHV